MSEPRRDTAIHEAAHAVVLYRTTGSANGRTTVIAADGILGSASDSVSDSFSAEDMEGEILSCYAGGAAQRRLDPAWGDQGCGSDDDQAAQYLAQQGWSTREAEFRTHAEALVERHWPEIQAVADELLRSLTLDETEVAIVADWASGDESAKDALAQYRRLRESSP